MLTVRMRHGNTTVARLPEEVDYQNAALIGAECDTLIRRGCRTLVLDASHVRYLDSSGISMLVKLAHTLEGRAGTLRLANLNAQYRQVWRILGLDALFPIAPTVNSALVAPGVDRPVGTPEEFDTT